MGVSGAVDVSVGVIALYVNSGPDVISSLFNTGLYVKSGPEVIVALADGGVEGDDVAVELVVVQLNDVEGS